MENDLFNELFSEDASLGDEPKAPAQGKAKPAAQPQTPPTATAPAAVPPKPAEPKPPETPKVAEAPKTPEAPKPAETPKPNVEPPKQPTDEERKAHYTKWRGDSEKRLEQLYQMSPEDGESMLSKPEAVMPKLAARLHMDVYEAVLGEMQQHIPRIFASMMDAQQRVKANEDQFFSQFPKLRGHEEQVVKFMQAFRQINPTMPRDEFAAQVGTAMMAALKIQPDAPTTPASAPAAPQIIAREVVDPNAGFVPAPVAGVAPAPAKTAPQNEFAALAEEFLKDS